MKQFWCVNHKLFDSGNLKVRVFDIRADNKPADRKCNNMICEEHENYFDTYEDARNFVKSLCK